jgi:Kef-type K+ transport system membrane component KefB
MTINGLLMFVLGIIAYHRGYGIGWAVLFSVLYCASSGLGVLVIFPWLAPDKVKEVFQAVIFYDVVYFIVLIGCMIWNKLSTPVGINIFIIMKWLSVLLGLLTFFAVIRNEQLKRGKSWRTEGGFGTLALAIVFVLCSGLCFLMFLFFPQFLMRGGNP